MLMLLDFRSIGSKADTPMLRLRTLAGTELGVISNAYNLQFNINLSEESTIDFDVPYMFNGIVNPVYDLLSSFKVIYTEKYGIYLLTSPKKSGNGVSEVKHVSGYSLEKTFSRKRLFLEEGTYPFWSLTASSDTILGRITELDSSWSVGYVSPVLIDCYRTFDEYDSDALSFCYGDAAEKYNCAVVFDVYNRTINAYVEGDTLGTLPIYLSYQNLVDTTEVEELSDDIVTKLRVYGADDLTIRDVNPAGTDYLVNLDYFIENGELDITPDGSSTMLSVKFRAWEAEVAAQQETYAGLAALRASGTAQKLVQEDALTELKGELDTLTAQQSITIQALAMETTDAGKASQQQVLDTINTQITAKKAEIADAEDVLTDLEDALADYATAITTIHNTLAMSTYFTANELAVLEQYLMEGEISEDSFVATSGSIVTGGTSVSASGSVSYSGGSYEAVDMEDFGKTILAMDGGEIFANAISDGEQLPIMAQVIRATTERVPTSATAGELILTGYLADIDYNGTSFNSGLLTISCSYTGWVSDEADTETDLGTQVFGTQFSFDSDEMLMYFSLNAGDYQQYAVAKELYDYGIDVLDERSRPVYEFSIDSANFLFQEKFEPFKNVLELGKAVYLELGSDGRVEANIIGLSLDFENPESFELVFSNRFQKKNGVRILRDTIRAAASSGRSFDAGKYIYNRTADQSTAVANFMQSSLNAAVNNVIGASNESVVINGAGIQIGSVDTPYQIRITDSMIAFSDDSWATAKIGIGRFATSELGTYFGINADVIGGKLLVGENLVIENETDDGVMQFQVDSTGVWLYNSRFVLQSDGGSMLIDPDYGLAAGTNLMFTTSGTTVTPAFIDEDGDLVLDSDGMPAGANFYLDISDGSAYFRGVLNATSGEIGGFTIADGYLHTGSSGSFVALNGSGTNANSAYAIWAGAENPASAPFYVMKNGTLKATNGTFSGTLEAAQVSGALTAADDDAVIVGCALGIGGSATASNPAGGNFYVDSDGNVYMNGGINLSSGSITWGSNNPASGCITASQCRTIINQQLVASPQISGCLFTNITSSSGGSVTYDTWLELGDDSAGRVAMMLKNTKYGDDLPIYKVWAPSAADGIVSFAALDTYFLSINATGDGGGYVYPLGTWCLTSGTHYGSSLPNEGVLGQIFFLVS